MKEYGRLSVDDRSAWLLLSEDRKLVEVRTSPNLRFSTSRYCHNFAAGHGSTKAWRGAAVTTYGLGHIVHGIHIRLSEHEASASWKMGYGSNYFRLQAQEALSDDCILDIWNVVSSELQRSWNRRPSQKPDRKEKSATDRYSRMGHHSS